MLTILNNGLRFSDTLQYAWFHLQNNGETWYRVVALKELAVIPVAVREDYDLMSKTWASLRGLHDAGVNFVFAAAGMYKPSHVGIIQYFGAAAQADSEKEAAAKAMRDVKAIEANLAGGFSQAKLGAPNLDWFRWYLDFVTSRAEYISVILGHPDPRAGNRGFAGSDGKIGDPSTDDLANEQNEILFRGLSRLRENFVFQVLAERRSRTRMHDAVLKIAEAASNVASRRKGAISIGMSLGIPIITALGQSTAGSESRGEGLSQSQAQGVSEGWSDSYQKNESQSTATSHTRSVTNSEGGGSGTSATTSQAETQSESNTTSRSESNGTNWSRSSGSSVTHSTGGSNNWSRGDNWSQGNSVSQSQSVATGSSQSEGSSQAESQSTTLSGGLSVGGSGNRWRLAWCAGGTGAHGSVGGNVGGNVGIAQTNGNTNTESQSHSTSQTNTNAAGVSTSSSQGGSSAVGGASTFGTAHSSSQSSSSGGSHTVTEGTAQTTGRATTEGTAQGNFNSRMWSRSEGESWTTTQSRSEGQGWGLTESTGRSYAQGQSDSISNARALATGITGGFSTGLLPALNINRSWQTEDDVADRMTDILRSLEGIANQASAEGGFMTNVWLFTETDAGQVAAQALVPQAFHGPAVPTPVMSVNPVELDIDPLRAHAISFVPWTENGHDTFTNGDLWTEYATLLNCQQLAAYVAPGLFEEGSASTVMAPIPQGIGFYPDLPGDAVLGHQYSPETADLTPAQVRVAFENLMHTAFVGDTGFGKSVAAIRMAYETTLKWRLRTVVLDFGAGWRTLLNAPGLEGHVDILQLWPDAVRPMRWNPLQIGRHISPETQWRAFADVFGAVAQLGVKRQKQEMLDALRTLYLDKNGFGVLVDDPKVRSDARWGLVQPGDEANLVGAKPGSPIATLPVPERQKLAVYRSSKCGLADLYKVIEGKLAKVPPRDQMLTGVLEGILFRMNPLVQGAASTQFAPGPDCIPVEDFSKPWGVTIIEGGMFLDEFGKAFLLGWTGWHLYMDMVSRRVHEVNTGEPLLQIFYEEANKIFVQDSGGEDSGGMSASQRFSDMFRDARKYKARLHVVTQAPSLIAQDIMSSCNNMVIGFIKQPKDKDLVLSALARSEKGFRDEEWRRFVDDIPIGMAIGRFPYTTRRELQRPMLFRPLMLDVPEPTDAQIERVLGASGVPA
jgi:hypothetical protein